MKPDFLKENRPLIIAMVQAKTTDRTIELIEKGIKDGAEAFGVQLETLALEYHTKSELEKIVKAAKSKPIYITNYRYGENEGKSDEQLAEELIEIAGYGFENIILDVMGDIFGAAKYQITYEDAAIEKQKQLIEKLHSLGAYVLMSSHTECFLPENEVLKIACAQIERGADIPKIVIMANDEAELLEGFRISTRLKEKEKPILFLCAGDCVHTHRRLAPFISNSLFLCVVEYDRYATPVQPLLSTAMTITDALFTE